MADANGEEHGATFETEREARNSVISWVNDADNYEAASEEEQEHIHSYFINTDNFVTVPDAMTSEQWDKEIAKAKEEGYAGLVYRNQYEDKGSDSYVIFDSNAMKGYAAYRKYSFFTGYYWYSACISAVCMVDL